MSDPTGQGRSVKPEPKIHAGHIECAVVDLFNYRVHICVPNVSWGFLRFHEADLLIIDKDNRLSEVEIKISLSDLKADFKKHHGHSDNKIGRLIYAVPDKLVEAAKELVPKNNGIIRVKWNEYSGYFVATWVRGCRHHKLAKPITDSDAMKLMRLGCMRIWSLKKHNNK